MLTPRLVPRHVRSSLVALFLGFVACAEDKASAPPLEVDAGPQCERGTENCACTTSGRCDDPLLCVAGRCLASGSDPDPPEPPLERPTLRPPRPDAGRNVPDAALPPDASVQPTDAAAPHADAAPPEAGQSSGAVDSGPG